MMVFAIIPSVYSQDKYVAMTMDDLLNAFHHIPIDVMEHASDSLLHSITTAQIPVTVFVNDKSFLKIGETDRRLQIYSQWINNPLISIGNHTFSHLRYATTPLSDFEDDIIKGETFTRELLSKTDKKLCYFRFPFNCTCKDSNSKAAIYKFLHEKGYTVTPFTIESSDYMYNALYCNYVNHGDNVRAQHIVEQYLDFTIDLFRYFETLTDTLYGRSIRHIFLCHTNRLHAACSTELITRLHAIGYKFISLDEALQDDVYQQNDYYNDQYGFSWVYRWIKDADTRKKIIRQEPYSEEITKQFNELMKN